MTWAFRQRIAIRKRKLTTTRSTLMRHSLSYRDRLRSSNTVAAAVSVAEGASGIAWLAAEAPQNQTGKFVRDRKVIPWSHWKFESGSQEIRNYCPLTCVLL